MFDFLEPGRALTGYNKHRQEIRPALIKRLCEQFPQDTVFLLFYPLALLYVTRNTNAFDVTLIWGLAVYVLCILRLYLNLEFNRRKDSVSNFLIWAHSFTLTSTATGVAIGVSMLMLVESKTPVVSVFSAIFVVGIVSANLNHTSSWLPAQAAFTLPATLIPAFSLVAQPGWLPTTIAVLLIIFFVLSILLGRQQHRRIVGEILLELQNHELVETLTLERNCARKADESKSRFLAAASHDLRQPIHSINLLLETLKGTESTSKRKSTEQKLARAVDSLSNLLNSLLDISKLDAGVLKANKKTIQLEPLIERVVERFQPEVHQQALNLIVETSSVRVKTDPDLLDRVIANILSNAIKFTHKGSITLSTRILKNKVTLTISDSGFGISEENLGRVFDEFFQEYNPERDRSKGIGLGLSICKHICELLDHRLVLESSKNGTTVSIELSQADNSVIEDRAETINKITSGSIELQTRALLIEDDPMVAEAMMELLERWGCEVRVEIDASAALQFIDKDLYVPDVVIADLRLPGELNGIQLILAIHSKIGPVPSAIITGATSPDRILLAKESGIQVLFKPLQPARLRLLLERIQKTSI